MIIIKNYKKFRQIRWKFTQIYKMKLPTSISTKISEFKQKSWFLLKCVVNFCCNACFQPNIDIVGSKLFVWPKYRKNFLKKFFSQFFAQKQKYPPWFYENDEIWGFCGFKVVYRAKLQPSSIIKIFFTTLQHHISSKKILVDPGTLLEKIFKKTKHLHKSAELK